MRRRRNHLKRVLVRSEKSLIVAPPLNEGEATSFARRVCQCVDYVLLKKKKQEYNEELGKTSVLSEMD